MKNAPDFQIRLATRWLKPKIKKPSEPCSPDGFSF
jgi:hypothetical protein